VEEAAKPMMKTLDLHGERAARRGNPSFVWRGGQDRRLAMILEWGLAGRSRVDDILVDGCGVGMYVRALAPYTERISGIDIEQEHLAIAARTVPSALLALAAAEALPFASSTVDLVLSHEVLEHVADDRAAVAEMVRVLRPGGRAVIFVPNRWYPFETHGIYWQGSYRFGNIPLVNYLPDRLRSQLAPHVRAYTAEGLRRLFVGQPVRVLHHTQIFPGYDTLVQRRPGLGRWLRRVTYLLEESPLCRVGLSHLLVVERVVTEPAR